MIPCVATHHEAFVRMMKRVLKNAEEVSVLRNDSAALAFRVLIRVAVPLLQVYAEHPGSDQLYSESMLALRGRNTVAMG